MDHLKIAKAVTKHEWPIKLIAMLQKYLSLFENWHLLVFLAFVPFLPLK